MAGDWIPITLDLSRKREVLLISAKTGLSRYEVMGRLIEFWAWISSESADGTIPGISPDILVAAGPFDAQFIAALEEVGWVAWNKTGLRIPNFDRWLSRSAKARLLKNQRQADWRSKQSSNIAHKPQSLRPNNGQQRVASHTDSLERTAGGAPVDGPVDARAPTDAPPSPIPSGGAPVDGPVDARAPTDAPTTEEKRREENNNILPPYGGTQLASQQAPLTEPPKDQRDDARLHEIIGLITAKWNAIDGLQPIRFWSQKRKTALRARLKDKGWFECAQEALRKIPKSRFLLGHNDRKWRANIDWFLRPDSVYRILEGAYRGTGKIDDPFLFADEEEDE